MILVSCRKIIRYSACTNSPKQEVPGLPSFIIWKSSSTIKLFSTRIFNLILFLFQLLVKILFLCIRVVFKKVNRKVQGMPQSQTAANPRHQEEAKKDKNMHVQNKCTRKALFRKQGEQNAKSNGETRTKSMRRLEH